MSERKVKVRIEFHAECPLCGHHVPYHCETEEEAKKCKWMRKQRDEQVQR
jgi:hypothetical protein